MPQGAAATRMEVTMFTTLLAMVVGAVAGAAMAGPLGGVLGTMFGLVAGVTVSGVRDAVARAAPGAAVVREDVRVLCVPTGQVATASYVREAGTGKWLDVARCSLCTPADNVACAKRCLLLVRDSLPPRRHPVAAPAAV
ncbi:MAG: hypothetical protein WBO45_19480 [Planctomycetota bacterium]